MASFKIFSSIMFNDLSFFVSSIVVCIYVVDDNFKFMNTIFCEIWSIETAECDR